VDDTYQVLAGGTYQVLAGGGFAGMAAAEELARTLRSEAFEHRLEDPARGAGEEDRT
jgi:hypothetical protein